MARHQLFPMFLPTNGLRSDTEKFACLLPYLCCPNKRFPLETAVPTHPFVMLLTDVRTRMRLCIRLWAFLWRKRACVLCTSCRAPFRSRRYTPCCRTPRRQSHAPRGADSSTQLGSQPRACNQAVMILRTRADVFPHSGSASRTCKSVEVHEATQFGTGGLGHDLRGGVLVFSVKVYRAWPAEKDPLAFTVLSLHPTPQWSRSLSPTVIQPLIQHSDIKWTAISVSSRNLTIRRLRRLRFPRSILPRGANLTYTTRTWRTTHGTPISHISHSLLTT
ncbi:hypothetical protein B0H12DRAFT_522712 [Mycena haematopus]|nr:hypothetical protein B0H12DRAFT_522712 [Mycena haematopus]